MFKKTKESVGKAANWVKNKGKNLVSEIDFWWKGLELGEDIYRIIKVGSLVFVSALVIFLMVKTVRYVVKENAKAGSGFMVEEIPAEEIGFTKETAETRTLKTQYDKLVERVERLTRRNDEMSGEFSEKENAVMPGKEFKDGTVGKAGEAGERGNNGEAGERGKDGIAGERGKDGVQGKDGENGKNGINGKSAYDTAAEAGYTGTQEALANTLATAEDKILEAQSKVSAAEVRIAGTEENLAFLQSQTDALQTKVMDCFQSVSNGKNLLAGTITDKGIATAGGDSFETMSTNIKQLSDTQYNSGFIAGQNDVYDNINITYEYHCHEGNEAEGNGCYTVPHYAAVPVYTMCGGTDFRITSANKHSGSAYRYGAACTKCEKGSIGWYNGDYEVGNIVFCGSVGCGSCTYRILSGNAEGNADNSTVDGWSAGCGYAEGQVVSATIQY